MSMETRQGTLPTPCEWKECRDTAEVIVDHAYRKFRLCTYHANMASDLNLSDYTTEAGA